MLISESKCPVFMEMEINKCCGCEACVQVCPTKALSMKSDTDGFMYPVLEEKKCIKCVKCVKVCPILSTIPSENKRELYFGASHIEDCVLLESASGGLFTFLYKEFKKKFPGGLVAGAVYSHDFKNILHIISDSEADIQRMRTSKYFQSQKTDIYILTKKNLESGKAVFFTGAPCEVAALQRYLGKNYELLWTMDFICKGSSTPRMLSDYIDYLENKMNAKISGINMRYKWKDLEHWLPQFLRVDFNNGRKLIKEFYNTELGICFQILQREGCEECPFREKKHMADFTIGDLHAARKESIAYNHLGTSVIVLNSEKSFQLWETFDKSYLKIDQVSKGDVYNKNRNLVDQRYKVLKNNFKKYDGVAAVRNVMGIKEKIKMNMPVMLLRRMTSWRREHKK